MFSQLSYRLRRLNRSVLGKPSLLFPTFGALAVAPEPLMKLEYIGRQNNRTLIIFLPGIDDVAEDFERRGFILELQREGIAADAVAVDAHYGYYAKRSIVERMTEDVIASAHAAGYEKIWLAGISLGGFGAASYAARYPSHISGLVLFAPYLGGKNLIEEIADAGGVKGWEPGHVAQDDFQRSLWAWFKRHAASATESALPIYIGYGTRDMFSRANALFAEALPHERVFVTPGRHEWRTWHRIWRMFLAQWQMHYG